MGGRGTAGASSIWRIPLAIGFSAALLVSGYGTIVPASLRCAGPAPVGCTGGPLGPPRPLVGAGGQWFDVVLYDYGFWITNTVSGANESSNWTIFENFVIHVNTTSEPPVASLGGNGPHGLGLLWSPGTAPDYIQQAPQGSWASGSFLAPNAVHHGATVYCITPCGTGHSGMTVPILNILPATPPPVGNVSASPLSGYAPLRVSFGAAATGGTTPYEFFWNFGDSNGSSLLRPSHVYGTPGTYYPVLTVIDRNGLVGTAFVKIVALGTPPFTASVSASPSQGAAPLTVSLTATASGGIGPYLFSWSLGDGGIASGPDVVHRYPYAGSYFPSVTAEDQRGVTTSATALVRVTSTNVSPLALVIALSPDRGDLPLSINGTASVIGGQGTIAPVTWVFGDGTPRGSGPLVRHEFASIDAGAINVSAFVTDSFGERASATRSIDLFPAPRANLTVASPRATAPSTVSFSVALVGGNGSFSPLLWDFGDGTTTTDPVKTSHTFARAGNYSVSVSTTDSTGRTVLGSTWVNLTANRSSAPPITGSPGVVRVDDFPLLFLGAVGATGLLVLFLSGRLDARRSARASRGEEAP